jgi:hypothetical protein
MNWKQHCTEQWAEIARFLVRGALLIDLIIIAGASIYLTYRFCARLVEFIDRMWLSAPWGN